MENTSNIGFQISKIPVEFIFIYFSNSLNLQCLNPIKVGIKNSICKISKDLNKVFLNTSRIFMLFELVVITINDQNTSVFPFHIIFSYIFQHRIISY